MEQRRIGDVTVSAIGLGAMPLSTKEPRPSPADAEAVVHAALDAGVTLIDTADAYSRDESEFGHNEELVANALRSYGRTDVLVATKGGHTRPGRDWGLDGSPAYLRRACEASLRRLHVDAIGLYQFHRPDPATPWEESMGALRSLFDDGLVRMVGISNADIAQIDAARAIVGDALVSVQNQFSPGYRSSAGELAHCAARRPRLAAVEPVRRGVRRRLAGRRGARPSRRWPTSSASRSTGSRWPGTSRRPTSSCRSRARPGRRRSSTRPPRPTSSSPPTSSPGCTPADPTRRWPGDLTRPGCVPGSAVRRDRRPRHADRHLGTR